MKINILDQNNQLIRRYQTEDRGVFNAWCDKLVKSINIRCVIDSSMQLSANKERITKDVQTITIRVDTDDKIMYKIFCARLDHLMNNMKVTNKEVRHYFKNNFQYDPSHLAIVLSSVEKQGLTLQQVISNLLKETGNVDTLMVASVNYELCKIYITGYGNKDVARTISREFKSFLDRL